eukprot:TRINITY_DN17124_c0_g1_i1.p1 TRINITY_DN17124_c0_g1~~TRINITY_DN17124_c0_g1_i1.p1  ORF type:complete len:1038 (+),score=309.64 TRINITY_DN17124_c0_g1_i1:320-3115(+)
MEVLFFAAQSMRSKVRAGDPMEQLDQQQRGALQGQLLGLLLAYGAGPAPVRTQLCLATAVALAQEAFWHEDRDVVTEACSALQGCLPVLLELLTLLAEEATRVVDGQSDDVTPGSPRHIAAMSPRRAARRHPLIKAVQKAAPGVLHLLHERWGSAGPEAQPALLRCLARWLRFAPGESGAALAGSALVHQAVSSLADHDDAADVAAELARLSGDDPERCGAIIAMLSAQVPQLAAAYRAAAASGGSGVDKVRRLCRALASIGESYCAMIAQASPDALTLVDLLVECSGHPDGEGVAAQALGFWSALNQEINSPEMQAQGAERSRRVGLLSPLLLRLCDHLLRAIAYDCEDGDDFDEDVEGFRDDLLAAAASDVVGIVDTPALVHVWTPLGAALQDKKRWAEVEARLFFTTSAFTAVSEPSAIVPHVVACCQSLPAGVVRVRRTYTRLLARCAPWLSGQAEFGAILSYCAEGVSLPRVADAASAAMLRLCSSCHAELAAPQMYSALLQLCALPGLTDDQQERLCRGVGAVIGEAPLGQCGKMIEQLVTDIGGRMQRALQQGSVGGATCELRRAAASVDAAQERRADKTAPLRAEHAVAWSQGWGQLWPLLQAAVPQLVERDDAMAAFALLTERTLKAAGASFAGHLGALANCIAQSYMQHPSGALLDCVASMCNTFGQEQQCVEPLLGMLSQLSEPTLGVFLAPGGLAVRIDLVRGYFKAVSAAVAKMPAPFLGGPLGATVVSFALKVAESEELLGQLVEHETAISAALRFLDEVVDARDEIRLPVAQFLAQPWNDRGASSAAAAIASCTLRLACDKKRRTLPLASAAAIVFYGAFAAAPAAVRAVILEDAGKISAPPPAVRELVQQLRALPVAHSDQVDISTCDLCQRTPPGGVVRCRGCGCVLTGAELSVAAFERLYLAVPAKAGGGRFD